MIRARIFRNGPSAWTFTITEDVDGEAVPFIVGDASTWREAWSAAADELRLFAERDQPPAWEIPKAPPLVSPAATERSWLARFLQGAAR
jgi:hypothetical protein